MDTVHMGPRCETATWVMNPPPPLVIKCADGTPMCPSFNKVQWDQHNVSRYVTSYKHYFTWLPCWLFSKKHSQLWSRCVQAFETKNTAKPILSQCEEMLSLALQMQSSQTIALQSKYKGTYCVTNSHSGLKQVDLSSLDYVTI